MRVLNACEFSGVVRRAFRALGHDAYSCDILPAADGSPFHIQADVRLVLEGWMPVQFSMDCDPEGTGECRFGECLDTCSCIRPTQDGIEYQELEGVLYGRPEDHPYWDLMIAHPPCTYLAVSGMHRTTRGLRDPQLTEDALDFVRCLLDAPIERIALENPVSVISSRIRKPTQIIQPYEYGHDASKKTCLWLKNLPPLVRTHYVMPRQVNGLPRWANQTDSGQNRLPPTADRWALRSETYQGIADAMAEQWGGLGPAE